LRGAPALEQRVATQRVLQLLRHAFGTMRAESEIARGTGPFGVRQADHVADGHGHSRQEGEARLAARRSRLCRGQANACVSAAKPTQTAPLPTLTMPVRLITVSNTSMPWSAQAPRSAS